MLLACYKIGNVTKTGLGHSRTLTPRAHSLVLPIRVWSSWVLVESIGSRVEGLGLTRVEGFR